MASVTALDYNSSDLSSLNKERLRTKFRLAFLDDIENKKRRHLIDNATKIKDLLALRSNRFTVVAHGVTKSHVAKWWSNFGFPTETIEDETYSVLNFVSCQHCFVTYRYGSSSTETISRHQCQSSSSDYLSSTKSEYSFTLDQRFVKQKHSFRRVEQQQLTTLITHWICDNLRPISIIEDEGFRKICSYFYELGMSFFSEHFTHRRASVF